MTPDPTACSVARTINGGARHRRQTCSRADCYAAAVRPAFRDPRARLSINPITSVIRTRRPSGHVERNERAVVWLTWRGVGETDRAVLAGSCPVSVLALAMEFGPRSVAQVECVARAP